MTYRAAPFGRLLIWLALVGLSSTSALAQPPGQPDAAPGAAPGVAPGVMGDTPTAAVAEPAPSADILSERLQRAVERYQLSDALVIGREASARFADDPAILYWYGAALAKTLQAPDAVKVLERALGLAPTDRAIATLLLDTYWNFGFLDKARILAKAARTDFPDDPNIGFTAALLELEARIRSQQPLALEPDSPEAVADQFLRAIERGQIDEAITRHVSRRHLYQWVGRFIPEVGAVADAAAVDPALHARVVRFIAGMAKGAAESTFQEKVPLGFEVQPSADPNARGTTTMVTGYLLAKGHLSTKQVSFLHAALRQPELAQAADPELVRTFVGLNDKDRKAFSNKLVRMSTNTYWTVLLKMTQDQAGTWKVFDLGLDGAFWLSEMNALVKPRPDDENAPDTLSDSAAATAREHSGSTRSRSSFTVLALVGLGLIGAVLFAGIALVRRKRR